MFHSEESCGSCLYYMASAKICRRYPPAPIMVGVDQGMSGLAGMGPKPIVMAYFPSMTPQGWCGEYEAEPKEINSHAGNS
jgi:hypothetical protein